MGDPKLCLGKIPSDIPSHLRTINKQDTCQLFLAKLLLFWGHSGQQGSVVHQKVALNSHVLHDAQFMSEFLPSCVTVS